MEFNLGLPGMSGYRRVFPWLRMVEGLQAVSKPASVQKDFKMGDYGLIKMTGWLQRQMILRRRATWRSVDVAANF